MEQELQKYKVFDTSLQANIVTQSQIQVEIKGIVENIKTNSTHYRYFCISREKYNDLTKSWKSLASELEEVHIRLEKAEAGLIQLNSTIVPLETSILDFVEGRKVASGELIQRLHGYTMHSSLSPQTLNLVPPRETQLSYATSQLDIGSQAPASYFPQSSPYQGHYTNNLGIMNQTAPASQFAALRPPVPLQSPS